MQTGQNLKTKRAKYEFFDGYVIIAVLTLSAIGILMVFSITGTSIWNNRSGDRLSYMIHSATGVVGGIIIMMLLAFFPNKIFRRKAIGMSIFIGTTLLFFATLIWGHGALASPDVQRWITIPGVITFQAIDLTRIGFTLALPWLIQHLIDKKLYYSKKLWSYYLIPLLYILVCTVLVIVQPDLGSAAVILATGLFIFFSSGLHTKQIVFLLVLAAIAVATVAYMGIYVLDLQYYQISRIRAWVDPFNYVKGHQSVMGFISIALGGWLGEGIGRSTQALGFAIEPHTDLIVSILSEELGVVTVFAVMFLYLFIAFRCFFTALKARDVFSALVCIGVGSFFLAQPFVNLGGVSGFIPLSGVALPLISYGMTSKISTFALIGLYFNMRRKILVDVERHKTFKMRQNSQIEKGNVIKSEQ